MQTEVIYKLPPAAETFLVVCLGIALASLAVWLVAATLHRIQNDALRLEILRRKKEIKALDNWQKAYEDEKSMHIQDVADLSAQLTKAEKDIERMKNILAKAKVADL
jgi:hypothetical protein